MQSAKAADEAGAIAPLHIRRVVLSNFKRFTTLGLELDPRLNIFAGDNEAGKSTVMVAVDLALSASRSKVESLGVAALISRAAVEAFYKSNKQPQDLPTMFVELYLSDCTDPDLKGRVNSRHENTFGLRLVCEPSDEYGPEIL